MKTNPRSTVNSQTDTPADFDRLIISLGEALHGLAGEYKQWDEAAVSNQGRTERRHAQQKLDDLFQRIKNLQITVSTLPAASLEAAAVQMRALAYMNPCLEEGEYVAPTSRMFYSVLNAIEANGGGSRDQWGG